MKMTLKDYQKLEATGMLWEFYPEGVQIIPDKPTTYDVPEDPNVASVVEAYLKRAAEGMTKYGVTTERTDIDLIGWLNNLQEELMDATIYLERAKKDLEK